MKKKFVLLTAFILLLSSFSFAESKKEDELVTLTNVPSTLVYPSFWHTPFGVHRGTAFWLKVFLGNKTYFSDPQDVATTKMLSDYGGINPGKDDWQLTAFGVNSGRGEIIYNVSMSGLAVYGNVGTGDGEFNRPTGISCNEYGDVYVADTGNNRIVRLFYKDGKLRFIRNIGKGGSGDGEFNRPLYVKLDSGGKLYVSDNGNNRIQVFSKSGGYLYSIDQTKGISNPRGICVIDDGQRYLGYKQNYMYVIDGNFNRLQKFDLNGNIVRGVRVDEKLGRKVVLTTLDYDYYGNIYLVDYFNSQIHKFSPDLAYITSYGSYGTDDYKFEKPTGISIYRHYGQVIVSDKESAQYFWIGSDVTNFRVGRIQAVPPVNAMQFDFFLTEKSFVTMEIELDKDKKVTVCKNIQLEQGENSISWEIPLEYVPLFLPGMTYNTNIRVMATYSSYPHIEKVEKASFIY
ncbi:MAG: hypothetical protein CVV21_10530 [Candidatus Goldiibacteriota bacterium HGW-Goldbacteria-1]|jgi:hypothetical protein|nr:MAG: hypothetical protein CVV21_10530 [Candidatus Goldiibacteriota bacterium HGW-Goldbacteria-1]